MRRIVAILILAVLAFLVALVIDLALKSYVIVNFIIMVIGPTAFNVLIGTYALIINTIGIAGFVGIVLVFGFACGIVVMKLWRKVDLGVSGWSLRRRAKEMGTGGLVSTAPATPSYATTRPVAKEVIPEVLPVAEMPKTEQTKTEPTA